MSFLTNLYHQRLAENQRHIHFWQDYVCSLQSMDFSAYSDKLRVPALVPIGSRILFRGELKHTNEVTVALGADYFVKCSLQQAEVLRQHSLKDAQTKLETYKKEKEYIENHLSFSKNNVLEDQGQDIIENYSEEEDKVWREKHREKVREYKQKNSKESKEPIDVTDEELWNRLEELELQEELENELIGNKDDNVKEENNESFIVKEDDYLCKEDSKAIEDRNSNLSDNNPVGSQEKRVQFIEDVALRTTSKLDLLQKVLDKQNELEEKLHELKNKERSQSKSEKDLISKLDEMEELDELEDEMDRLDDILDTEDVEDVDDSSIQTTKTTRSVSFADEDDSETLEITFKHSDTEPCIEPYHPEKGILKPSDIYEAYGNVFASETTSILKKSKYQSDDLNVEDLSEVPKVVKKPKNVLIQEDNSEINRTIVIKDVVENVDQHKINEVGARPTSLFKKRRQQMKS